jgi:hypothetical protein
MLSTEGHLLSGEILFQVTLHRQVVYQITGSILYNEQSDHKELQQLELHQISKRTAYILVHLIGLTEEGSRQQILPHLIGKNKS